MLVGWLMLVGWFCLFVCLFVSLFVCFLLACLLAVLACLLLLLPSPSSLSVFHVIDYRHVMVSI